MRRAKKKSRQRLSHLKKNAKRLAAYSAAAAATTITAQHRAANAGEVVWDILDVAVGNPTNRSFNLVSGESFEAPYVAYWNTAVGSFLVQGNAFPNMYAPVGDTNAAFVGTGGFASLPSSYRYAYPMATSDNISAGLPFAANTAFAGSGLGNYAWLSDFGVFYPGEPDIVGLRFDINGSTHYGWMQLTRPSTGGSIVHGFGYNDDPNASSHAVDTDEVYGDLNRDDNMTDADWIIFRENNPQNLSGEATALDAYLKGDMDRDFDNDISDFVLFKEAYDDFNGPGAFSDMLANIPEPSSMLLLAAGAAGLGMWRKKKAG